MVEQAAHNRPVLGSNPGGPTNFYFKIVPEGMTNLQRGVLETLDPRLKILCTLTLLSVAVIVDNLTDLMLLMLWLIIAFLCAQPETRSKLRNVRGVLGLLVFTVTLNIFLVKGKPFIFIFPWLSITCEGLMLAIKSVLRIVFIASFSILMTSSMDHLELAYALKTVLKPLTYLRIRVEPIVLSVSLGFRFIPIIISEIERIYTAQLAKGLNPGKLSPFKVAKFWMMIVNPLINSTLRRAEDLALAMEMRGFYNPNRTELYEPQVSYRDWLVGISLLIFICGLICEHVL